MALLDFFKKPKEKELTIEHGKTGTEQQAGMITEDFNSDLQFPNSIVIYDEMRKSDATTGAILSAIKQPLISAKWGIQPGSEESRDKEIADFVSHNLFEKIKFKHFIRESLGCLDFGFYYFEKLFEIVDWKVEWKQFAPRVPKAHSLWEIKDKPWVDGHPAGVTQLIISSDESKNGTHEIPWDKLILFSFMKEGNNFEGQSILRNAYRHYFYKSLLYKVESVSMERYWVWVPYAKVKTSMSQPNKDKVQEFLKSIRSNEESFGVVTDDVTELKILTPEGAGQDIQPPIAHHDRKIYDSILAGFLNLTSGEGGSNALSKDQSSFFLRGLQGIADFFIDTMNDHIKELVDYNFNGVESYPKLIVADIGSISMDEQINAIDQAFNSGILDITDDDRQMIRDVLKMPRLTQEQMKDLEVDRNQKAIDDKKAMEDKAKQDALIVEQAKKKDKKLAEDKYSGCVMLNIIPDSFTEFKIDKKDLVESEYDGVHHVTLLFWLNIDVSKKDIIDKIDYKGQKIKTKGMKVFEWEENDVLVVEVEPEKWLTDINAQLRELDYKNDFPDYTPHVTLGYFKKGEAEKYIGKNFDSLEIQGTDIVYTSSADSTANVIIPSKDKKLSEVVKPTKRETTFTKNITEFEKYLEDKLSEAEKIIQASEKEYQEAVTSLYEESDTQRVDWVVCLVYDKTRITKGKNLVQKITDKLEKKLIDSDLQTEIFDHALEWANTTLGDNEKMLAYKANIKAGQINTFIEGYKSNMQGVIYNESRRVLENITLNYGSEASVELAKETASSISINRNILMLSFVTHPRAMYKFVIYNEAQTGGFTFFKTLVPTNKLPNVVDRPFWMTADMVFTIQTAAQINKKASSATAGKTAEAVTGLGLHHGSFEYYYPIASTEIELEEEIARAQREALKKKMDEEPGGQ